MASLHKNSRGRSPYWYAAYRAASGQRVRKSTGLKDRREAWEVALNLERAEREAAEGRLNEARVRKLLSDTMERITGRSAPLVTIRTWFGKWLDEKEADGSLSKNSQTAYRASVRNFLQHLGKRADEDLGQICADDIQPRDISIPVATF